MDLYWGAVEIEREIKKYIRTCCSPDVGKMAREIMSLSSRVLIMFISLQKSSYLEKERIRSSF